MQEDGDELIVNRCDSQGARRKCYVCGKYKGNGQLIKEKHLQTSMSKLSGPKTESSNAQEQGRNRRLLQTCKTLIGKSVFIFISYLLRTYLFMFI